MAKPMRLKALAAAFGIDDRTALGLLRGINAKHPGVLSREGDGPMAPYVVSLAKLRRAAPYLFEDSGIAGEVLALKRASDTIDAAIRRLRASVRKLDGVTRPRTPSG